MIVLEYPALTFKLNLKHFFNVICIGYNVERVNKLGKEEPVPCIANISVGVVWNKVRPLLINNTF